MPTTPDYIALLIQIPLVGIFVWFSLQQLAKLIEAINSFLKALAEHDEAWRGFIKQQGEDNQQFLQQQSAASATAIQAMASRFADEIRVLGKEIAALREVRSRE